MIEAEPLPGWFEQALTVPRETGSEAFDGVTIAWQAWGRPGDDLLVLVHGGGAHAAWWHPVAPLLAQNHRVVAMDLSGHGDSGRATEYSFDRWSREVRAVALAHSDRPAVVVGHSMGGLVALNAAALFGPELAAVIGVDIPDEAAVPRVAPDKADRLGRPARSDRSSRAEILARFRTLPSDPATKSYLLRHVGEHSVRDSPDGWIWKFDRDMRFHSDFDRRRLAEVGCDVSLIMAERSLLTGDQLEQVRASLESARDGAIAVTTVPDSGHHVMLDQPLALVDAIREHITKTRKSVRDEDHPCYYAHSSYS